MANTTFNTRLKLKYDSHENWLASDPILLKGEAAISYVSVIQDGRVNEVPSVLIKIGDGTHKYSELNYVSGLSADTYAWAKASTKPTYAASEIIGMDAYIADYIEETMGISVDTDTQYQIVKEDDYTYKFQSKGKTDSVWTDVTTIEIPQDALTTGTANGTVAFNGSDVAVKGLGSAAYTAADAYDEAGAAEAVMNSLLGSDSDAATAATIKGVQKSAAAAESAADNAQTAADNAQSAVDSLSAKIGTVPADKTVVEMIADAQAEATYDDTALETRVSANETAISTLNGTGEGSVSKAITDVFNDFAANVSDDGVVNTYKELIDYAASHSAEFTELVGDVTANTNAIATLNGTSDQAGSVAKAVADSQATLQANIDNKVDKVTGKGLSTNDYTTEEKEKLAAIADGAQVNVVETIKRNGVALTPDATKVVDIEVPTGALAEKDEVAESDLATALAAKINGKLDASAVTGDLLTHNAAEFALAEHDHDDVYSKLEHTHNIEDLTQESYVIFDCGSASTII